MQTTIPNQQQLLIGEPIKFYFQIANFRDQIEDENSLSF